MPSLRHAALTYLLLMLLFSGTAWCEEDRLSTVGADTEPRLACDGHGNWLAVWRRGEKQEDHQFQGHARTWFQAVSNDNGKTWISPKKLPVQCAADYFCNIASCEEQTFYLFSEGAIYKTSDSGSNWTKCADLSLKGVRSAATDRKGTWVTCTTAGHAMYVNKTSDYFGKVEADVLMSIGHDICNWEKAPGLATDGRGTWLTVWQGVSGHVTRAILSRSEDNGETWQEAKVICDYIGKKRDSFWSQGDPALAVSQTGVWVAAWCASTGGGGDGPAGPSSIEVAASRDSGKTWSKEVELNARSTENYGSASAPSLVCDSLNRWVVVWSQRIPAQMHVQTDSDILFATSMDGFIWTPPEPLNSNAATDAGDDFMPQVASGGEGVFLCAWASTDSLGHTIGREGDILFARSTDAGKTWSEAAPLNTDAATDHDAHTYAGQNTRPQIATDKNGHWVAVWQSSGEFAETLGWDVDILVVHSDDFGATWTNPVPLNDDAKVDYSWDTSPQIATDSAGCWVAVWNTASADEYRCSRPRTSHSTDCGKTWSPAIELPILPDGQEQPSRDPRIASLGNGVWFVVYEQGERLGGSFRVVGVRSGDNGTSWSNATLLNAPKDDIHGWGYNYSPEIAALADGRGMIAWFEGPKSSDDSDVVWFRTTTDLANTWSKARLLLNFGPEHAKCYEMNLQLTPFNANSWLVTWLWNRQGQYTSDLLCALSSDSGSTTLSQATIVGTRYSLKVSPRSVASDGKGHCIASWNSMSEHSLRETQSGDIEIGSSSDALKWTPARTIRPALNPKSLVERHPSIATDCAGHWVMLFESQDTFGSKLGPNWKILTSRSSDDGQTWSEPVPLWGWGKDVPHK